ncbi:insulin-like growth factor-binding protein 4 [Nothobranchius furzeri]|uniref:Keratin-associated protein 10-7-like n=1 Tax=Nothobranchius furzeri TaxID=105023 RepID=A0A9D2YSI4_NOTFU|nr:IGFBP domain-containing protein [Nothobranchius furzeri]KAF7225287.1 keratin-associated protein 10-7-like [Nothobranchius furzeri]
MLKMWILLFLCGPLGSLGSKEVMSGATRQLQVLHCPPCEQIHCSSRRALKLQCRGGLTTGVCGCCPTCARLEGETCGGAWDYLGKCDIGLVCVYQESETEAEQKGICKAVVEHVDPDSCNPECTRDYCHANPSAICSARSVSLENTACQGCCQHTSCSSCLTLRRPPCHHTCAPSDSTCLQHFGRCVHNHVRESSDWLCNSNMQSNNEGSFVCLVPLQSSSSK